MVSLNEYIQDNKCNFVGLEVDHPTKEKLKRWCFDYGFDLSKSFKGEEIKDFDFHTTVYFTHPFVNIPQMRTALPEPLTTFVNGIALFGPDKNIPVLKVNATPQMLLLRKKYTNLGLTSDYPSWEPHVTVSYNFSGHINIEDVVLPDFPIVFDVEASKITYKK